MKRIICVWLLFFHICAFTLPARVHAGAALGILAAAAVGASMLAASTGQYYVQTGKMPEYVSNTAGAIASASDRVFQPAYLAVGPYMLATAASFPQTSSVFLGKEAAIGAKLGDIVDHVQASASSAYADLKSLINQALSPAASTEGPTGAVWQIPGNELNFRPTGGMSYTQYASENAVPAAVKSGIFFRYLPARTEGSYGQNMWLSYDGTDVYQCRSNQWYGYPYVQLWKLSGTWVGDPADWAPPAGSVDYTALKSSLASPDADVTKDMQDVFRDLVPGQVVPAEAIPSSGAGTAPEALTPAAVSAALAANAAAVAQRAANDAAAVAAANPSDAAAQIAAQQAALAASQAAADAVKEIEAPKVETYPAINSSAFAEPYNPGEYDISERFSSFLNTVKSSGLFSFSSSFFNSLPGGGSPVYEIEAGQYGHHTIDLSQTLSTGLAVLKTILLACFGFLSIRAVIMKR